MPTKKKAPVPTDAVVIYTDGGSRGNPGPAAAAFVVHYPDGSRSHHSEFIGNTTNNFAEYWAIDRALELCIDRGFRKVIIRSDSKLAVEQCNGRYKIKEPELKMMNLSVREKVEQLASVQFEHIKRELNGEADALCDSILDPMVKRKKKP